MSWRFEADELRSAASSAAEEVRQAVEDAHEQIGDLLARVAVVVEAEKEQLQMRIAELERDNAQLRKNNAFMKMGYTDVDPWGEGQSRQWPISPN